MGVPGRTSQGGFMNRVDIRVFLHGDQKVTEINQDNEWLEALLSGDIGEEKKQKPKKVKRVVSNSQLIAIRGR
jgi:hypothetical protein